VHQPVERLGQEAWLRLMARIGGDTTPPHQTRLACTLELRDSSTPARRTAASTALGRWAQQARKETLS
jgi:hypothetical protein